MINDCYVCGSKMEIDCGGCVEICGYDWQEITISCTNDKCHVELTLSADFFYFKNNCSDDMVNLWNNLGKLNH